MIRKFVLLPVVCVFCVVVMPVTGYAQEGAPTEYEAIDPDRERYERERIIAAPGEGDYRYSPGGGTNPVNTTPGTGTNPVSTTPKDSVSTNQRDVKDAVPAVPVMPRTEPSARPVEKQVPSRGEDESILSFNFLYYIIQKYKLQDIID